MGDDFERAVLVSLNPTQVSPQTLQGAQALLAQFKASGDAWKLCLQKAFLIAPCKSDFSASSPSSTFSITSAWLPAHLPGHLSFIFEILLIH